MPKVVDHDQYRYEILMNSFKLVASRGFSEITIREIARELKISSGTLYHYFPNKKAMLKEMIQVVSRHELAIAFKEVMPLTDLTGRIDRLRVFIEERQEFLASFFLITIDYFRNCSDKEDKEFIMNFNRYISGAIAEILKLDKLYGAMIFTHLSGIIYQSLIYHGEVKYKDLLQAFYDIVMHCIATDFGKESRAAGNE